MAWTHVSGIQKGLRFDQPFPRTFEGSVLVFNDSGNRQPDDFSPVPKSILWLARVESQVSKLPKDDLELVKAMDF